MCSASMYFYAVDHANPSFAIAERVELLVVLGMHDARKIWLVGLELKSRFKRVLNGVISIEG